MFWLVVVESRGRTGRVLAPERGLLLNFTAVCIAVCGIVVLDPEVNRFKSLRYHSLAVAANVAANQVVTTRRYCPMRVRIDQVMQPEGTF